MGNNTGAFTITRTNTDGNLVVNYLMAGTATNGIDYSALSGAGTIPNGQTSVVVTVVPLSDVVSETNETVVMMLESGNGYHLGTPYRSAVTITENNTIVTVAATDASASERGPDPGTYTITRNNSSGNLVVYYTLSGTATNGVDYVLLPGMATIPNGQSTATVTIVPIDDTELDPDETILLQLSVSIGNYSVGSPDNAQITILDNESDGTFSSDPVWAASGNISNGNNFGYSPNTNYAGGDTGEIGGVFARSNIETYYADTNLTNSYNLTTAMTAAGRLSIFGQNNMDGDWNLGHMSTNPNDRSFMGIRFLEQTDTSVRVSARMGYPNSINGSDSTVYTLPNGVYNWTYTYDPTANANLGRLTVRIYNDALTYDQTIVSNFTSGDRASGATFNAFGIGTRGESGSINSLETIQMFVDDVTYTGQNDSSPTLNFLATDFAPSEPDHYAVDNFASNSTSGGTGWGGNWSFTGNASIVSTGSPLTGSYHSNLQAAMAWLAAL